MIKKFYTTFLAVIVLCCAQNLLADQITIPAGTYYFDLTEIDAVVTQFQVFSQATTQGKRVRSDSTVIEGQYFQAEDVVLLTDNPLNDGVYQQSWDNFRRTGDVGLKYIVIRLEYGIYIAQQNCIQYQTPTYEWHGWWQYPASVTDLGGGNYYCKVTSDGPVWQTSGTLPSATPHIYFGAGANGSVTTHTAGGSNISSGAEVTEGTTVNLVATPADGYAFYGWRTGSGTIISTASNYVFSMPATNLSLTAVFYSESTDPAIDGCAGCFKRTIE